jgi:hypothetical protein
LQWASRLTVGTGVKVSWYEKRSAKDPDIPLRVLKGFVMPSPDRPSLTEAIFDENGGVAWSYQSLALLALIEKIVSSKMEVLKDSDIVTLLEPAGRPVPAPSQ